MADLISGTCSLRSEKAGCFIFHLPMQKVPEGCGNEGREGYDSVKLAANVVSDNPAIRFFDFFLDDSGVVSALASFGLADRGASANPVCSGSLVIASQPQEEQAEDFRLPG